MVCWARSLFVLVVIVLGLLSMVSACGQKGPLYLPPPEPPAAPAPATPPATRPGADVPKPSDQSAPAAAAPVQRKD